MRIKAASLLVMAALAIAGPALAQDAHEVEEGRRYFRRICFACHTDEAGRNKIGPSLFGVVGRQSGTATGFAYSAAMKKKAVTWDDETLDKYLTSPRAFIPGNRMAFAGVYKAEDRRNVIAYLKTLH